MNMDFLDPRARRAHRRRLKLGYLLMSVLVAIVTVIILNLAYGYDIDRKTGDIIQNGIVFVDSKPRGAQVFLNDVLQTGRTDTRLVLPAGVYTVRLELDGYRRWERTFNLEGGEIERLVYPLLLPNQLDTVDVRRYEIMPSLTSQSPDRRWVLVQQPGQVYQFDIFDLLNPESAPESLTIPPAILSVPGAEATMAFVEWSTNNRHVLMRRDYEGSSEYLVLDRENITESININTLMGIKPVKISLKNKRPDQFYYLETVPGHLRIADTRNRTISAPLVNQAIEYKSYGDDILLFVTDSTNNPDKADFKIFEDGQIYNLKQTSKSDHYVLDVSKYENKWYYVAGASKDNITYVYEDPLSVLKNRNSESLRVTLMRLDNPRFVSFSANTQFVMVQSANKFLAIDLEDKQQYRTELMHDIALGYELKWMDGNRLIFNIDQQSYIVDFDGSNENTLVTSRLNPGPFFDRDYDNVFTFEESKTNPTQKAFTRTIIDN